MQVQAWTLKFKNNNNNNNYKGNKNIYNIK